MRVILYLKDERLLKNKFFQTIILLSLLSQNIFAKEVSEPVEEIANPKKAEPIKSACDIELDSFRSMYDSVTKSLNEKFFKNENFKGVAEIFEETVNHQKNVDNLIAKYKNESCDNIKSEKLKEFEIEYKKIFKSDSTDFHSIQISNSEIQSQSMSFARPITAINLLLQDPEFRRILKKFSTANVNNKCTEMMSILRASSQQTDSQIKQLSKEIQSEHKPITQIYTDHLNLLSHLKNEYISKQQKECKFDNFHEYVASCINVGAEKTGGLSYLLNNAESLIGYVENERKAIEDVVILESCNRLKGSVKDLEQNLCSKLIAKILAKENSASFRYTNKNEIPVFQDNTWKWAKKRSNVELFGAAALQGTTTLMPNWLGLMHAKQSINYEYMRAINIKSNNFYANQFYQNWLQNYYTNPQIFSPGQFNFGQSGGLQNIGYGF